MQTIELTGKDAKGLKLLSNILILAGLILIFTDSIPGHSGIAVLALFIGIPMALFARAMTWWKYK